MRRVVSRRVPWRTTTLGGGVRSVEVAGDGALGGVTAEDDGCRAPSIAARRDGGGVLGFLANSRLLHLLLQRRHCGYYFHSSSVWLLWLLLQFVSV
nr:hypothetical protein Itr_chr08CG11310 [Ipomoea trifida]